MTPDRIRELVAMTGDDRRELARLLGYASDNSLRQCEAGKALLPKEKGKWLERYAKMRSGQRAALESWLKINPPPGQNRA